MSLASRHYLIDPLLSKPNLNTRVSKLDTLFMIYLTVIVMVVVGMKILLSTLTPMTPTISIIINLCNILSAVQKDGILLANWQTILLRGMITIILSLI